jgi:hypothetical protein
MRVFKCTYVLCLLWIITGCSGSKDPYKMMIEHMLTDKTLLDELWCDGCNRITDYSVHDVVNGSVLDVITRQCLLQLNDFEIITETWDRNRDFIWPELRSYSTADISDFHVFFTERVMNVQAMVVFYLEATDKFPTYDIEVMYSRPLEVIWRFNTGVLYVFEFDENTGEIESVCRETIQIE